MTRPKPRYNKGDRIGDRYQVHQTLVGGMGEVYLCLDLEENYPLALKTFQQRYQSQSLRQAFEKEVATWVALEKHANIVRCFHMDILDNQPFMVLEWIAGEEGKGTDLRSWLRQGPLELKTALDFAIDICRGLVHAQQKQPGLVHRDLKTENILVAQGGQAKITDFGLAQIVARAKLEVTGLADHEGITAANPQQSLLARGGVAGTPPYMPPEQWQPGTILDERTDIYAVGCILYEMIIGHLPFTVDIMPTTPATYQRWLSAWQAEHGQAVRPVLPDTLPDPLTNLLTASLAREREARPHTVTHLLETLESVYAELVGQPPRPALVLTRFSSGDYNNRGVTYNALGQHEAALADFDQAIRLNPADAKAYSNRGVTNRTLGRYKEALADYAQALDLNPNLVTVYTNRGVAYDALGLYEEAQANYDQALRLNPAFANAYYNRGLMYNALDRYEEALADFDQALRFNPDDAAAYTSRGITYAALGRTEEALADFDQALRFNPDDAAAYINRGNIYKILGRIEAALADFDQALRLNPASAEAYYNRGNTYVDLGWYAEALAVFEQAIRLNPDDAAAYTDRGFTYAALGRTEEALADFDQALHLNPDLARAYTYRGAIHRELGQDEEALADYVQAIHLNPDDAGAYFNCGALLANTGRLRDSLSYFEKAAQLGVSQAVQSIAQVRQMLGETPVTSTNLAQQAFDAFQQAGSAVSMAQAVAQYPIMLEDAFIATVEQAINQQVPPAQQPVFRQRLAWLQQIARENNQ